MEIIEYNRKYKQDFIDFNKEWIMENFKSLEKGDFEMFENIEILIKKGAMIYFAVENNTALATCLTMPLENGIWEICKLASNSKCEHKGCGSAVFAASVNWALKHGAKRIYLISNTKLKPALHIYKKFGFREVKLKDYEYSRGNVAFEYIV